MSELIEKTKMKRVIKQLSTPISTFQSCLSVLDDVLYDFRYKVDTCSEVAIQDLDISNSEKEHADKYKPTRTRYFRKLIAHLKPKYDGVFVDVGCGKGRILMLAAMLGFQRIRGIEISAALCKTCSNNVDSIRRRLEKPPEIEVICASILDYQFRHDETFVFLYSPFDRIITEQFLNALEDSISQTPRDVTLVINEFRFPELLENCSMFQLQGRYRYGAADFRIYKSHFR